MRRPYYMLSAILSVCLVAPAILAQQDRLEGRWSGAVKSIQGTRPAVVTFKKSGDSYTGVISGLRGDTEVPLSDIKLEGNNLTAKSEIESPQGSFIINYALVLEGDSLKGKGELDLGGIGLGIRQDEAELGGRGSALLETELREDRGGVRTPVASGTADQDQEPEQWSADREGHLLDRGGPAVSWNFSGSRGRHVPPQGRAAPGRVGIEGRTERAGEEGGAAG